MECYLVYMTAANQTEAERIGRALVERRLAACVNILSGCRSLYWWEGQVQSETEVAFVAKTTAERFPALVDAVKSLHSYTVPCIVGVPIHDGNPDFLRWIWEETRA